MTEEIVKFIKDRPCLSVNCIEQEAGVSRSTLGHAIAGNRSLSDDSINKIVPVLEKYGFKPNKPL